MRTILRSDGDVADCIDDTCESMVINYWSVVGLSPRMGADSVQGRIPGRAEEFARRVLREGLPVARLWEGKSALVSLGLNQRGKPGLWIVQKMR